MKRIVKFKKPVKRCAEPDHRWTNFTPVHNGVKKRCSICKLEVTMIGRGEPQSITALQSRKKFHTQNG